LKSNKYTNKNTEICAAFCGTGKSYLCSKFPDTYKELECWEYRDSDFPENYIANIMSVTGDVKYLFISTDPIVLNKLHDLGIDVRLIYPKNELKLEYLRRYKNRNSSPEFIAMIDDNWDRWINELKEQLYTKHTILESGEFLLDRI